MSASVLENDPAGQARYRTAIVNILSFATEKLNDKAVYANTLGELSSTWNGCAWELMFPFPSVLRSRLCAGVLPHRRRRA